jgi:two-component system, OmpR family, alkaline phosphatase synthesis response regulator PhoP
MSHRILLVEDDPGLRLVLSHRLASEGYRVETAADGEEGLRRASGERFDLVVLDVMLPGRTGFDVCHTLRLGGVQTPVLMLTALGELADRVTGLNLGADDYVTKPFEMAELLARIEVRLRRVSPPPEGPPALRFGAVEVDFRLTQVRRDGRRVELTAKEFRLLRYLISRRGETVGRNELLDEVWGYDATPSVRTVDVHVAWLRRKLEDNPRRPRHILTIHGRGYRFVS